MKRPVFCDLYFIGRHVYGAGAGDSADSAADGRLGDRRQGGRPSGAAAKALGRGGRRGIFPRAHALIALALAVVGLLSAAFRYAMNLYSSIACETMVKTSRICSTIRFSSFRGAGT